MKILKIILIIIASIIGLFIIIPVFLSSEFQMERSIEINAPAKNAFVQVNVLKNWEKWSPWGDMDSNMVTTYSGPESGVGASFSWTSQVQEVGKGKLTIKESDEYSQIKTSLLFSDSDEAGTGSWTFSESDGVTTVTWGVSGSLNGYFEKWFGVFMSSMMGPVFEKGLAKIKEIAENLPEYKYGLSVEQVQPQNILFIADSCGTATEEIGPLFGKAFAEITTYMGVNNIGYAGQPLAISRVWDMENGKYVFDAGMPVPPNDIQPTGRIRYGMTYSGKAVKAVHVGPYDKSLPVYEEIMKYIKDNALEVNGFSWEVYINDPYAVKPEEIETHIYFPVK